MLQSCTNHLKDENDCLLGSVSSYSELSRLSVAERTPTTSADGVRGEGVSWRTVPLDVTVWLTLADR